VTGEGHGLLARIVRSVQKLLKLTDFFEGG
jgi:hypothetical protein